MVAFVFGAFCVWWLLFVVPLACMACMCARGCALPAWRPTNTKLHPTLENGTAIFWRSCANLFWFFFFYVAFNLAPPAGNSHLSRTHYFICFVLLPRCFGVASLPRRCFGIASALLRRCLRVASALLRRSFGVPWASALLRRRALQLRCNFSSTLAQRCVRLNQNLTARCSDAHLCDLWVACSLQDRELLKALNTFRFFNHERHSNTCFEVYWT